MSPYGWFTDRWTLNSKSLLDVFDTSSNFYSSFCFLHFYDFCILMSWTDLRHLYLDVDLYLNFSSTTHLYRAHSLRSLWPHYLATRAQPALKCSFVPLPASANLKKMPTQNNLEKIMSSWICFLFWPTSRKSWHRQTSSEAKMHLFNFCSKWWLSCRCWPIKKFYLHFLNFLNDCI